MSALPEDWSGTMDAVLSNPPYVRSGEWEALEPEVRDHDPKEAIVAGATGLEAYEALVPQAARVLRAGKTLILELGDGQAASVRAIVAAAGFAKIGVRPDLRGIPRVLVAEAP
jgi:release factor glutamine methyltransferase